MLLGLIVWVALSLLIIIGNDLLSFKLKRKGLSRFFSTFFLSYAQIIFTEFALGMVGALTQLNLIAINLLIIICVTYFVTRIEGRRVVSKYVASIKGRLRKIPSNLKGDYTYQVLLVLSLIVVGWVAFLGLLFPVTDVDGNSYHMTFIANSIQNHSIRDVETSLTWLNGYPKGGELIQMWNVLIPGSDTLADLAQIPFILLGVVSLYALARRIGTDVNNARFISLTFIFLPIVINQAKTTYVDIILCALFFAALAFATKKKMTRLDLLILGIIFAMLVSVKSTGLLFVIATFPFLLYSQGVFSKHNFKKNHRILLRNLLLIITPLLFGLYWYVKNLIIYGSPLYPFGLKVFGVSIFPGRSFQDFIAGAFSNFSVMPDGTLQRLWFVWSEQEDWFGCLYNYDSTFSGLGPIWFILLFPAIIIGFILALRNKNYLVVSFFAVITLTLFVYPANYYSRYTIFIAGAGALALGLILHSSGLRTRLFVKVVTILIALNVVATTFTLCNFPPHLVREQVSSVRNGNFRSGAVYENTIGKAYMYVQSNVQSGETVVYDSKPYFIYPLWRADLANKVLYIKASDKQDWFSELDNKDVRFVFTNRQSREHDWIQDHAEYQSVYKDVMYEIYEAR